ncbi:DUF1826 domain-containing protein [Pseudomonas sp. SO81]|uniref:DUF1826 domain-containing protein n=1 Tax=Pseudomonas sp. SO81 TaxID=2983246 RepID=UPI0025A32D49|nr:DUF1826 domain-containing protein [Pseudomonas sp. SO81]WJN61720.1 hypothetical protein OH686_23520 [Pseudomonas sp. SO81]
MQPLQLRPATRQVLSEEREVLTEVLHDGVNLAVWQRRLVPQVADFVELLLAQPLEVAESLQIDIDADETLRMPSLLASQADLQGHEAFVADVTWLIEAFSCLLDARRIGLRLRSLAKPMCPRFHIDHVPLRLITTYAGLASEWLKEGVMDRRRLGDARAEPGEIERIQRLEPGWVALAKGEKWSGNEGAGVIHRSPTPPAGERRLLLTLDWLA